MTVEEGSFINPSETSYSIANNSHKLYSSCSTMSIEALCNQVSADLSSISPTVSTADDTDVRIAAEALGDMRFSAQANNDSGHFIDRVSNIPLVKQISRVYEHSKATSRVVKYGAETVESSVKAVFDKLVSEEQLDKLDSFACRQLDKIGGIYATKKDSTLQQVEDYSAFTSGVTSSEYCSSPQSHPSFRKLPVPNYCTFQTPNGSETAFSENQVPFPTSSRLRNVLVQAGAVTSTVSEESMRKMKYCLELLQLASNHITQQLNYLREHAILATQGPFSTETSLSLQSTVSAITKEVVETLRKVVSVVAHYASSVLPGDAQRKIRKFILCLPERYARLRSTSSDNNHSSISEAQRVISFSNEVLLMMQRIADIFSETIELAKDWIQKLHGWVPLPAITSPTPDTMSLLEGGPESMDILTSVSTNENHSDNGIYR